MSRPICDQLCLHRNRAGMCGLTGIFANQAPATAALRTMADALRHRGPDAGDVWLDAEAGIGLGHRRLSILDLSPAGNQPMHSACGRYVIAFNGEVYNHLELRQGLERAGIAVTWRGRSDTETLLACFAAWGVRATLERTVGMFALALWDRVERRLRLARDRFGEKPLYYGWSKGAFVFGSELSALRRHPGFNNPVDRDVVALYLQFCYVPAPYAIYRHVYKLEPGCLLSLSLVDTALPPCSAPFAPTRTGSLSIERYWSLPNVAGHGLANPIKDDPDAVEKLESALSNAVRLQTIADVPLGAFLSGGVDSSIVVALMQAHSSRPVRTFTIGFDEAGFDEARYAKSVAMFLGTEHTELYVSAKQARDVIPRLPNLYSEPFADSSQIPTHLVSNMARQHVTVALSGDGGDELFGGYNRYFWGRRIWNRVSWLPSSARRGLGALIERIPPSAWDTLGKGVPGMSGVSQLGDKAHKLAHRLRIVTDLDDLYRSLVTEWDADSEVVPGARRLTTLLDDPKAVEAITESEHRMMLLDALTYLPDDILHKVDRAAMGVSLETRAPFLDHRVVELAWRTPLHMKIRHGQGKWVLRQVLDRHVPRNLIERPKAGFGIPLDQWLRGPLREWAEDLLVEESLMNDGLGAGAIREKWRQHLAGTHSWTGPLWAVLMYRAWIEDARI